MYPHERSLVAEMKDKPFVLIGVNSDKNKVQLQPRREAEQITWRSFWNGSGGTEGPISKAWHVSGWPTIYVIDHTGKIVHKSHGGEAMNQAIEAAVAAAEKAQQGK